MPLRYCNTLLSVYLNWKVITQRHHIMSPIIESICLFEPALGHVYLSKCLFLWNWPLIIIIRWYIKRRTINIFIHEILKYCGMIWKFLLTNDIGEWKYIHSQNRQQEIFKFWHPTLHLASLSNGTGDASFIKFSLFSIRALKISCLIYAVARD